MRLLVVDDEPKTTKFLAKGLRENDYQVECAATGDEGRTLALTRRFDLLILDVMLPRVDGFEVLAALREAGRDTPVLFLTARDQVADRVRGLKLGADDYLVKPFAFVELLARVQSILRRTAKDVPEFAQVGELEIDFRRHRVTRGGDRIELTPKEFALLALLARRVGEPVTRTQIAREIWEVEAPSDSNVVDVHVRRLRAKLDDPYDRKLLHTVRGVGYRLAELPADNT